MLLDISVRKKNVGLCVYLCVCWCVCVCALNRVCVWEVAAQAALLRQDEGVCVCVSVCRRRKFLVCQGYSAAAAAAQVLLQKPQLHNGNTPNLTLLSDGKESNFTIYFFTFTRALFQFAFQQQTKYSGWKWISK